MSSAYAWTPDGLTVVRIEHIDGRWLWASHNLPPARFAGAMDGWYDSIDAAQLGAMDALGRPLRPFHAVPSERDSLMEAMANRPTAS